MDLALHDIRYAFDSEVLTLHENAFQRISLSLHDELFLRPGDVLGTAVIDFTCNWDQSCEYELQSIPGRVPTIASWKTTSIVATTGLDGVLSEKTTKLHL